MTFSYPDIERQLVEALPVIRPAAERYWRAEGEPGSDSGPYIFVPAVVGDYLTVLLALPSSPRRDELLRGAFTVVDQALVCGQNAIWELVMYGLYECRTPRWFRAARSFIGPRSAATLDVFQSGWDDFTRIDSTPDEIIDLYDVRGAIEEELRRSGGTPGPMPTGI